MDLASVIPALFRNRLLLYSKSVVLEAAIMTYDHSDDDNELCAYVFKTSGPTIVVQSVQYRPSFI